MDILFLIGRILFGGFFIMNGLNHFMKSGQIKRYAQSKGVPSPGLTVPVTGLLLLIGGLSILLGVYIEWGVLALAVFLIPVSFKMHDFWVIEDPQQKMAEMGNFMRNIALLGAALMMLMLELPWAYALNL